MPAGSDLAGSLRQLFTDHGVTAADVARRLVQHETNQPQRRQGKPSTSQDTWENRISSWLRGTRPSRPLLQALLTVLGVAGARQKPWLALPSSPRPAPSSAIEIAEVKAYLAARIEDWDVSVWSGRPAPSAVERRLRVRQIGAGASSPGEVVTAGEALAGQRMLVVLGGPGSGKTWLARRYAREAARVALTGLENGAGLDAVELPLLTTWDQWTKTSGDLDPGRALIAASFASGLGHRGIGGTDTVARLQRVFAEPGRRVLLVVDSLDEAADRAGQALRLRELTSLPGWRVVVTSRPAAWTATAPNAAPPVTAQQADGPRVVEVQDLAYPADVEAFIQAWFPTDPQRAAALIEQIRTRRELAQVAVIPLLLTFYCLLTEDAHDPGRPLPARRRVLYQRLIRRLLRSAWSNTAPGADTVPDFDACEAILRQWAWHAVRDRVTPVGLGDWGDTFTQPSRPGPGMARALDHVAPKVTETAEGEVRRRFVHRTVLEHLVAEHLATLPADQAAAVLLPHLWFDPDWQVTTPAAIAAHNTEHPIAPLGDGQAGQNSLLQLLLHAAHSPATDSVPQAPREAGHQAADRGIDRLLLAIAAESDPNQWTHDHQHLIDACRTSYATRDLAAVARTAHWAQSNPTARAGILAALPGADPRTVGGLVAGLPALDPTEAERAQARAGILAALPGADPWTVEGLVAGLRSMSPLPAWLDWLAGASSPSRRRSC